MFALPQLRIEKMESEYIELYDKYEELYKTYDLCDEVFDYDVILNIEPELEIMEQRLDKLENEIELEEERLLKLLDNSSINEVHKTSNVINIVSPFKSKD